jgi:3'-5' exoribonuclease
MRPEPRESPADGRSSPSRFCGVPWRLVAELADGEEVAACYLLREAKRLEARNSRPYLKLLLGDRTGTIDGFVWEEVDRWEPACCPDEVVGVRGRVASYQDRLQLRIVSVEPLSAGPDDLELLLPASRRPRDAMETELDRLIASVEDPALRRLLRRCIGRGSEIGAAYRVHPAAKRNHHAYLCGLMEHSVSVAALCDRMAEHYAAQGVRLDRDLLVTGALLHDVGKVHELKGLPASGYTTEGQLLGHIVLGIQLVAEQARAVGDLDPERLLLLQHLIASHQGRPEWDSPRVPQMREALVLHYADDLDAKLNQAGALLEGVPGGEWSAYDRGLSRSFFQPPRLPSNEVEPVSPDEAVELIIDLFRG